MCAHNGTHIDAPFHFIKDGKTVDAIDLASFVGMAYVAEHQGIVSGDDALKIIEKVKKQNTEAAKRILIKGVDKLQETCFRVPADRIVAGTYLIGCMVTGGSVFLKEAPIDRMRAEINIAERMGLIFQETAEGLFIQAPELVRTPGHIITDIYPGFSTDMQSAFLVAMAVAQGDSILTENIFENSFHIADELKKMGANIQIQDRSAYIKGVGKLNGANVRGEELRGTAALIVAGLKATGHTCVTGCEYVYRGYENIGRDLRELGARVYSI